MKTAFFYHPTFNIPVLAEICHWEGEKVAYVRWLEQGTNGFNCATFAHF